MLLPTTRCRPPPACRAGSTLPATAGVSTSASLVSACKMRCATLLLLLGPLRPADGVAAAQHWLDAAQQPGQVRRGGQDLQGGGLLLLLALEILADAKLKVVAI